MDFRKVCYEGLDWIYLAPEKVKWRSLVLYEVSGFIIGEECLDQMRNFQLLKKEVVIRM
jgi:hypothetical protein